MYAVLLPISYLLERKNKLSLWTERIITALIVYPIVYLFVPASDILNFFIASVLLTAILLGSEKWIIGEKERLPEWEGEERNRENRKE
jgi:hypothetical protein